MVHPALAEVSAPEGVLFDAGGTLVQVHVERLVAGLERAGCAPDPVALDRAFWESIVLLDSEFAPSNGAFEDWWRRWQARLADGCDVPVEAFREVYDALDAEALLWEQPVDGAVEALDRLRGAGVPLGVVSNADGRIAEALTRAGLADRFDVIVDSTGRWNSQDTRPRAYMFFARDASLRVSPNSLTDSTVIPVRSTGYTWNGASSLPGSRASPTPASRRASSRRDRSGAS